jgi:hypothetical protein
MASISSLAILFFTSWLAYVVYEAIYRLHWSPIAHFPGPKLAALTRLYELYFEIVKGGQYTFKIGKLHEKYGKSREPLNLSQLSHFEQVPSYELTLGNSISLTQITMMSSILEQARNETNMSTTQSNLEIQNP